MKPVHRMVTFMMLIRTTMTDGTKQKYCTNRLSHFCIGVSIYCTEAFIEHRTRVFREVQLQTQNYKLRNLLYRNIILVSRMIHRRQDISGPERRRYLQNMYVQFEKLLSKF